MGGVIKRTQNRVVSRSTHTIFERSHPQEYPSLGNKRGNFQPFEKSLVPFCLNGYKYYINVGLLM